MKAPKLEPKDMKDLMGIIKEMDPDYFKMNHVSNISLVDAKNELIRRTYANDKIR